MIKDLYLPEDALAELRGDVPVFSADGEGMLGGNDTEQAEIHRLAKLNYLLDKYTDTVKISGMDKWFKPGSPFSIDKCPKHKAFFEAGAIYGQRLFMASNRTGKSVSGALELCYHLTGRYPTWWRGRRFDKPINAWAMGSTARATRDTVQKELVGPVGAWGTGMLPSDSIGKMWALSGVPQGIDVMQVKHVSGGWSTVGFKNYEQPIEAFYGAALDVVWADEIVPINIYNECLVRTMTTHGIIYCTFTPLTGLTPLVVKFCEDADYLAGAKRILGLPTADEDNQLVESQSYKAIIQAGWDDAPWLSEDEKKKILDASEPHLRATRSTGVPSMGSGAVYPMSVEQIVVEPFEIPRHFKRLFAMDVGWNVSAGVWLALDPNTDTIYIYDEHYLKESPPAVHAAAIRARGDWIPMVIDPASRGRSQGDGSQLIRTYREMGLNFTTANNDVEGGITSVWNRLSAGRLKIFTSCTNLLKEYVLYRRDEKGRIVKENDHALDSARYGVVEINKAKSLDQMVRAPRYSGPTRYRI